MAESKNFLDKTGLERVWKKTVGRRTGALNASTGEHALLGEIFNDYTNNKATGEYSHAEGYMSEASGCASHAEGGNINKEHPDRNKKGGTASGSGSHAEGALTVAQGPVSHAEGLLNKATGSGAHAEGGQNEANANGSHAEGVRNIIFKEAEGGHVEGIENKVRGVMGHSEGFHTESVGFSSHSEGCGSQAIHLKGAGNAVEYEIIRGMYFNESNKDILLHQFSTPKKSDGTLDLTQCPEVYNSGTKNAPVFVVANLISVRKDGERVFITLDKTLSPSPIDNSNSSLSVNTSIRYKTCGSYSHTEGAGTRSKQECSHVEGDNNTAEGMGAHAEGAHGLAQGNYSHSEGFKSWAEGDASHAEGGFRDHVNQIYVNGGHAKGVSSHAEGQNTITNNAAEHAQGIYNNSVKSNNANEATQFSIGQGTSSERKNLLEVKKDGTTYIKDVGSFNGNNYSSSQSLQEVLNGKLSSIEAKSGTNINKVGTPTVSATTVNNKTTLIFDYLKGEKGLKGDEGFGIKAQVNRNGSFTDNDWINSYGKVGHNETWSNTSSSRTGLRVGDLFTVVGTSSDGGNSYCALYRSTNNSGELNGNCLGYTRALKGKDGGQGKAATIEADNSGTVSGYTGGQASVTVTNTGDSSAAKFRFDFKNIIGKNGVSPHIETNGFWYVGTQNTNVKAKGEDGISPYIGSDGFWYVENSKTNVKAKGDDGISPYIGGDGFWYASNQNTGVKAKGDDGISPHIESNGFWYIGNQSTNVKAKGEDGISPYIGSDGFWYVENSKTNVKAKGENGDSAYQVAKNNGYSGTESQWIASLKGEKGDSAYQVAGGNTKWGSEANWLASLKGPKGDSAYVVAGGDSTWGNKDAWLASLKGDKGDKGDKYIIGVYKSALKYTSSQCLDYSQRNGGVSWGNSDIENGNAEWASNIGKKILLIVQFDNGDNYISFQTISAATLLTPDKDYWINYKGKDMTVSGLNVHAASGTTGNAVTSISKTGNDITYQLGSFVTEPVFLEKEEVTAKALTDLENTKANSEDLKKYLSLSGGIMKGSGEIRWDNDNSSTKTGSIKKGSMNGHLDLFAATQLMISVPDPNGSRLIMSPSLGAKFEGPKGVTSASGFYDTSDERLKNFKEDINIDFEKLKSIPKKYFTWKSDETNKINLGTSAQVVKEIYPEIVGEDDKGMLSVDYAKLSIVALKAVDQLHDENEILKARLDDLENKLNLLLNK